jgi:hypothetical protein
MATMEHRMIGSINQPPACTISNNFFVPSCLLYLAVFS